MKNETKQTAVQKVLAFIVVGICDFMLNRFDDYNEAFKNGGN